MPDHRAPPNKGRRWTRRPSALRSHHRCHGRISGCPLRPCSPVWLLTLIAVVVLTTVNVLISLKLTDMGDAATSTSNSSDFPPPPRKTLRERSWDDCRGNRGFRFLNHSGRSDNSRKYVIHDSVRVGRRWSGAVASSVVCLATQTSVDQLFWLPEVALSWQGPVSVSVFVPGEDYHVAALFIGHLTRCFPVIEDSVSFHFVYPASRGPKRISGPPPPRLECGGTSGARAGLRTLLELRPRSVSGWRPTLLYPQNHMRNVARKGCPTPFVLLTDVDIIPRRGLGPSLRHFLRHPPCERCAFVVPTYEVEESVSPLPSNKTLLVDLVRTKKAQPFHNVVFINNQFATNASKWEALPEEMDIAVAYPVTNFELYYEPFYVARDDVPPHDERFVGYGYTRNTQVYEMFVANYKFLVLNSAFAMHRGLKLKKSKNSWREKQNRANSRQFKKFEKEIMARYGYNKNVKP